MTAPSFRREVTASSDIDSLVSERMTAGDYEGALAAAGRNAGPYLLFEWILSRRIGWPKVRDLILGVWSAAEHPEHQLGTREWVHLFRKVGFVSEPPEQPSPTESLELYRGSAWSRRRGMAWTWDRGRAEWFAARSSWLGLPGLLFSATVAPEHILAMAHDSDQGRAEAEVVISPAGLPPLRRKDAVAVPASRPA